MKDLQSKLGLRYMKLHNSTTDLEPTGEQTKNVKNKHWSVSQIISLRRRFGVIQRYIQQKAKSRARQPIRRQHSVT